MSLPDFDKIPSLHCSRGMFNLERWPDTINGQITFLKQLAEKFGGESTCHLIEPYDGYPGWINVKPIDEIRKNYERDRKRRQYDKDVEEFKRQRKKDLGL